MTHEELQRLIAAGESLAVEFKGEERAALNDRELVEAVVCLANRQGTECARLLIGVEDDGRITGARPRHGSGTDVDKLAALVANRTRPSIAVNVEVIALHDQAVIVIEVPYQRQPVGTSEGVYLRRVLGGDGRPAYVPRVRAHGCVRDAVATSRSGIARPLCATGCRRMLGRSRSAGIRAFPAQRARAPGAQR